MREKKTIRLTQFQLSEGMKGMETFLKSTNTPLQDGETQTRASGKLSGADCYGTPLTSDRFASMSCPQGYNRFGSYGNGYVRGKIKEEANVNVSNRESSEVTPIPHEISMWVKTLSKAAKHLTPRQKEQLIGLLYREL